MKFSLNMGDKKPTSGRPGSSKFSEADVIAAGKEDWTAKNTLISAFSSLLSSMADERTDDPSQRQKYIEAGKEGILQAVKKHKPGAGTGAFQISVVSFIESRMDSLDKGGFFARLFGNK